jgi:hypothetical protein
MGEKSFWADSTPDDRRRGEYFEVWASEERLLIGRADIRNVVQGPLLYQN